MTTARELRSLTMGNLPDDNIDSLLATNKSLRDEVVSLLLAIYSLQESARKVEKAPCMLRRKPDQTSYVQDY